MKKPIPQLEWPVSWQQSYEYDRLEVFGETSHSRGYAYAYANRFNKTIKLVEEALPKGSRILDIAAAQGNFTLSLAERGYQMTWNDLRFELEDYVKLKYEHGQVAYAPGNVFELNFDQLFDGVIITEIIEHVAHPDEFLRQVSKLLRPGGYVIMTTPNGGYIKNDLPRFSDHPDPSIFESSQFKPNSDGHIFLLYPDEVIRLGEEAGLEVDKLILFTPPFLAGHVKTHLFLPYIPKRLLHFASKCIEFLPSALNRRILLQMGARLIKRR
jgi:2-polyprenyl-3-methyl-5-hydroxy-6-metoxy-1,4-benzoquinol methylase